MNKKTLRKFGALALSVLVLGSTFAPVYAQTTSNNLSSARNLEIPQTSNVTLHKLQYKFTSLNRDEDMFNPEAQPEVDDVVKTNGGKETPNYNSNGTVAGERDSRLGELDDVNKPGIQNTGRELNHDQLAQNYTVSQYQKELYGDVEFTLYELDRENTTLNALIPTGKDYKVGAQIGSQEQKEFSQASMKAAEEVGDAIEKADKADTVLPYGAKVVERKLVNNQGKTTFENVKTFDTVNTIKKGKLYIIVETLSPKTVVAKSKPMFLYLPFTNEDGTNYITDLHLYPKNEVKEQSVPVIKYKNDKGGNEGLNQHDGALEGAKFHIYKGVPENHATNEVINHGGTPYIVRTDNEGKIDIKGLVRGQYYLVELETDNLVDGATADATKYNKREGFKYLANFDYLNNKYNTLTFHVDNDGLVRTGSEFDNGEVLSKVNPFTFINHYVPEFDKELIAYTDGSRTFDNAWDYFENIPFKLTFDIPDNLYQYSKFEGRDQLEKEGAPAPEIGDNVTPTTEAEFVKGTDGEIAFEVTTDKGETLERNVDFWITDEVEENNKFRITFADPSKANLTAKEVTPTNTRFSEKVLNAETITVIYHAQLKATASPDVVYNNRAEFTYNNAPEQGLTKDRYENDREEFKTYGHRFIKEDAGLFNTQVGKKALADAHFLVRNEEGKYFNGYTHNENAQGGVEPVWVEFANDKEAYTELNKATNPSRKDAILVSDDKGHFEVRGLKEGTYTLVEVKAPEGYRLPLNPETSFEVANNTYTQTTQVRTDIQNERKPEMPLTGAEVTTRNIGIALAASTVTFAVFVMIRKRKEQEQA